MTEDDASRLTTTTSRRIFVVDAATRKRFLVDTGADLCVYPHRDLPQPAPRKSEFELVAANGTPIATYGTITLSLNLGLRREFTWRFIIADVDQPIIGVDFLAEYNLLVDARNKQLCDATTRLTVQGQVAECAQGSVRTIAGDSVYHRLLATFPEITRPDGLVHRQTVHDTVHHILTTPGPPVAQRPRRLAPDRLQAAKQEFDNMVKLGIARPSKSPWASPLHMVPKQDGWRPCGDYRALNNRTEADSYPVRHIQDFAQSLHGTQVYPRSIWCAHSTRYRSRRATFPRPPSLRHLDFLSFHLWGLG